MWYSEVVGMYINRDKLFAEKQWMLDQMFDIVKSVLPVEAYAMKGGYTLRAILNDGSDIKDFRKTSDIDLDIISKEYFTLIADKIVPLVEQWVNTGSVHKYTISEPKDNATGNIKLYRKRDENTKAFVFCGIDIAVHPVSYGIIMLEDNLPCYAIERMLADKFWSMYFTSNKKVLYHRMKDILDIYLIGRYLDTNEKTLNEDLLISCVKKRMDSSHVKELGCISTFELIFQKYPELVIDLLRKEIDFRISPKMINTLNVEDVINDGLAFINFVLGVVR